MFEADHLAPRAANHLPLTPLSFLSSAAARSPDSIAVIWDDMLWTYAEFLGLVLRLADTLRKRGVRRGDVVSILARNRPEMLAAHYAVPWLGAVLNTLNTRLDADTLEYILGHACSRIVLIDPDLADPVEAEARKANVPTLFLAEQSEFSSDRVLAAASGPSVEYFEPEVLEEWQALSLNYTSGTTGRPKGVVYHHRGAHLNALGNALALGFSPATRYLWTLPMFHCNGWCHTWAVTAAGGVHVCLDSVEPAAVLAALDRHRITHMACAPVVLTMLLNDPGIAERDAPKQRVKVATGGAAPTPSLIAALDRYGFDPCHLYGLTECFGPATIRELPASLAGASNEAKATDLARQGAPHATAGVVRITNRETGDDTEADGLSPGEICLRSNTIMAGYFRDPEATEAAFENGYLHTGDIAVRDPDNAVRVTDRAKDIIISGGENISSLAVESVLHRHEAVSVAAVVAAPDDKWGEVPWAFIELKPGANGDAAALEAFCRDNLAGFQRPRKFLFCELPKTATGKIQKFVLRERARAGGDD